MKFEMKAKNTRSSGPKKYSFELSLPGLVGLGSALLLGLVWVFIFGVLVGRGYDTDTTLVQDTPDVVETAELIQPGELNFFDELQDTPQAHEPAPVIDNANNEPEAAPLANDASEPVPSIAGDASPAPEAVEVEPEPEGVASADTQVYNYLYQAASFRNEQSAMTLLAKIQELGLRAEVEQTTSSGTIWYRVNVRFQGTPADTRGLKEKLQSLGLDRPLLRSKVPA
ncbi:MAG: SPOR domain-containing protein [Desulfovibrio sp.]|nr:MAG: SPOR domain-containing protein [Desulfovibrio sp.]